MTIISKELSDALADVSVVMMCGVSGSGKPFFAQELESRGFIRLSADVDVWNAYGSDYAQKTKAEQHIIYMGALAGAIGRVPELLQQRKRVVIDASMCKRARRDDVAQICSRAGVGHVIVYLDSPRTTLLERLKTRGGSGPDDQFVSEAELEVFLAHFEPPCSDERFIHIKNSNASTKE